MCLSYFTASRPCYLQCWFWTCLNCILAIFMVAIIGQTIMWFLLSSSFLFFFFPRLISAGRREIDRNGDHMAAWNPVSNGENRIAYLWTNLRYIPCYCYAYSPKVTPFLFDRRIFQVVCIISDIAVFVLKRDVKLQPTNQPRCLRMPWWSLLCCAVVCFAAGLHLDAPLTSPSSTPIMYVALMYSLYLHWLEEYWT